MEQIYLFNSMCLLLVLLCFFVNKMFQVSLEDKMALSDKLINSSYAVSACKVEDQEYYKVSRPVFLNTLCLVIYKNAALNTTQKTPFIAYLASVM